MATAREQLAEMRRNAQYLAEANRDELIQEAQRGEYASAPARALHTMTSLGLFDKATADAWKAEADRIRRAYWERKIAEAKANQGTAQ